MSVRTGVPMHTLIKRLLALIASMIIILNFFNNEFSKCIFKEIMLVLVLRHNSSFKVSQLNQKLLFFQGVHDIHVYIKKNLHESRVINRM